MATLLERAIGAAKLDAATYEEVEHDAEATSQALIVVLAVALAAGIGTATGTGGLGGLLFGAVGSLLGWVLWAAVTYLVGTRLLPGPKTEADFGQLLRTLGFSATPGALQIFSGIPAIGFLIGIVAILWQLAAMVVAVRQALDYDSTGRAIAVCVVGLLLYVAVFVILGSLFGR